LALKISDDSSEKMTAVLTRRAEDDEGSVRLGDRVSEVDTELEPARPLVVRDEAVETA
jgi:hypothetical protein